MDKIDPRKQLSDQYPGLYRPSRQRVIEVDVPALRYLMVDGAGDPNTSEDYARAVEALFSVSYAAKFKIKRGEQPVDYRVMPLEGLWWAEDMETFISREKSSWEWTMMILQPDFVSDEVIGEAIEQVRSKKGLPGVDRLRLETLSEGRCAQVLHIGPFDEEGPTIERLHAFIDERSSLRGKHHEIYLSDIRRAAPEKWRTIIRQPMAD